MHAHPTHMNIFETLSRVDLEIHKVSHQKYLTVDGNVASTKKIINYKYNTDIKFRI
jgi:hypothetical protein